MHRRVIRLDAAEPGTRKLVDRRDTHRIDRVEQLPDGSIRVDALVTKTGVFTYLDAAGNPIQEYRPPEEVQAEDSVSTLRDRTVTVLHPPGLVDPSNWKQHAAGHVSGSAVASADGVKASLVVSDADAIKAIQRGDLKEISCGYQLYLEDSPGTTPTGEKYDRVQRGIRYNHVAMGPAGWGRQGPDVSMRLDSAGNQVPEEKRSVQVDLQIYFDGKLFTVKAGSQEHTDLLNKIAAKDVETKAKLDAADKLQKTVDTVTAERDVLKTEKDKLQVKLDAAPSQAIASARARLVLETKAAEVLGKEYNADSKTDREVKVAIIQKYHADFSDKDRSDDYVQATFDAYTKDASNAPILSQIVRDQADPNLTRRQDSNQGKDPCDPEDPDPEAAHAKMRKDQRDSYKRPLAVSKQPAKTN